MQYRIIDMILCDPFSNPVELPQPAMCIHLHLDKQPPPLRSFPQPRREPPNNLEARSPYAHMLRSYAMLSPQPWGVPRSASGSSP